MYAVISTGGKQERVEVGTVLDVERLGAAEGEDVSFTPVLLVDGESVVAGGDLSSAVVTGRVVGTSKGPKITGFTYKAKARGRRRYGHRQGYSRVEITTIENNSASSRPRARRTKEA